MANLNDILARIAPPCVGDVAVTWDLDCGGHWIEVVGWFSPGVKLGEPKHEVPIREREPKSGDQRGRYAQMRRAHSSAAFTRKMQPAKRKPGRPRKIAA
jgi:hypothetical protein